jgi:hypothetical protein
VERKRCWLEVLIPRKWGELEDGIWGLDQLILIPLSLKEVCYFRIKFIMTYGLSRTDPKDTCLV